MATSTKKSSGAGATGKRAPKWTSRAVIRDVEAGSSVDCALCGERVKFQAKMRNRQVICNVYEDGKWNRVEHFHAECYANADNPHGEIVGPLDQRRSPSPGRPQPQQAQAS